MASRSIVLALLLALSLISTLSKGPIPVTVYVSPDEDEDAQDYVEITMKVSAKDTSLNAAVNRASQTVKAISERVISFCKQFPVANIPHNCDDDALEVGQEEIDSIYDVAKRESIFREFVVNYEVQARVYNTSEIGPLADSLQKLGVKKFESFQWKSFDEDEDEKSIVDQALEKAEGLCAELGYKVDRIVEIERFEPEEEEEEQDEEEEGNGNEQQQEEDEELIYKVQLECVEKKAKASASKAKGDEL